MDHINRLLLLLLLVFPVNTFATDYYISPTGSDAGDGSVGSPWKSLEYVLDARVNGGTNARVDGGVGGPHTLYMTGGVYDVSAMSMADSAGVEMMTNGSDTDETLTIKSVDGEWAILDATGLEHGIRMPSRTYNVVFENFEIRNADAYGIEAGQDAGSGAARVYNSIFRNLYIHDNNKTLGRSNPAGIVIAPQECIFEYLTLKDNGAPVSDQHNYANLTFLFQYTPTGEPGSLSTSPRRNNIVRYNVIDGANSGFKNKGAGNFNEKGDNCGGTNAITDEHPEWANEIHHNVFKNQLGDSIYLTNDYMKIHNNVFDTITKGPVRVDTFGAYPANECELPYKAEFYNNTVIDNGMGFRIQENGYPNGLDFEVYNNLFINSTIDALDFWGVDAVAYDWDMTSDHNAFDNNRSTVAIYSTDGSQTLSGWQGLGFGFGSLYEDFTVDAVDYSLPVGSPAIDADRAGTGDIGAVEYGVASWVPDVGYDAAGTPTTYDWCLNADDDDYYTGSCVNQETAPTVDWDLLSSLVGGSDCDDTDPLENPGATQICGNGIDEQTCGVIDDTCPPATTAWSFGSGTTIYGPAAE